MIDGVAMSPSECVKKMKEEPSFWNLFKPNVVAGIGGSSGADVSSAGRGGKVDLSKLTSEEYRRLRKENPAALGLDRRPEVRR